MKPNQDPLDDLIMRFKDCIKHEDKDEQQFKQRCITKAQFKQALLKWRSDYVNGLLPKKHKVDWYESVKQNFGAMGMSAEWCEIYANHLTSLDTVYNQALDDIRAKNERGRDE